MKKIKKCCTYVFMAALFFAVAVFGIDKYRDAEENKKEVTEKAAIEEVEIGQIEYEREVYYWGEELKLDLLLENKGFEEGEIWVGCSLLNPDGEWIDAPPEKVDFLGKEKKRISLSTDIEEWMTGTYSSRITVWNRKPIEKDSPVRISEVESSEAFRVYRREDSFESFDGDFWIKRDGRIGQTIFDPENILLGSEQMKIKLPANTLDGGEIQTKEEQSFGSYEICMKLPKAYSSITGFFLYKEPDFDHEIDIEVYNQTDSYLLLTTYEKGEIRNEYKEPLGFDPTEDYHRYRIDYYRDRVSFYIDGKLIRSWTEGFSSRPMKLMVNSWYPRWLEGVKSSEDKYTLIKWIKY